MNIALSVLNAAALVALVAFHFQDDGKAGQTEQVASQMQPHHLLRQAPQLAIMTERGQAAILANDSETEAFIRTPDSEQRWVF